MSQWCPNPVGCAALAAGALFLAACGPSLEDVVAKNKDQVESRLAKLKPIAEQLPTLPPLLADGIEPIPVPILVKGGEGSTGNAALVHAEDLANVEELGYVWKRLRGTERLARCAAVVRLGHVPFDAATPASTLTIPSGALAAEWLGGCVSLKYLFVVRALEFVAPKAPTAAPSGFLPPGTPDGGTAPAHQKMYVFEGGLLKGEVLAFDLESGALLGGFRMDLSNSAKFSGTDSTEDLRAKLHSAVMDGLHRYVPGSLIVD